jgi:predicted nucleic acid-binding protein
MLLVDSSIWIQIARGATADLKQAMAAAGEPLAITEPIVGEVLAGAHDPDAVEARLASLNLRALDPSRDYRDAAMLYRACRRRGMTIRSLTDCLIAAVALRYGDVVAHRDADFERIAEVAPLRTLDLR